MTSGYLIVESTGLGARKVRGAGSSSSRTYRTPVPCPCTGKVFACQKAVAGGGLQHNRQRDNHIFIRRIRVLPEANASFAIAVACGVFEYLDGCD